MVRSVVSGIVRLGGMAALALGLAGAMATPAAAVGAPGPGHTVTHQYFYEMFGCLRMIALGSRYAYLLENAGIIAPEADFARTNPGCKVAHGYLERGPVTS